MAAAAAMLSPVQAPQAVQASVVAWANPPGNLPNHLLAVNTVVLGLLIAFNVAGQQFP